MKGSSDRRSAIVQTVLRFILIPLLLMPSLGWSLPDKSGSGAHHAGVDPGVFPWSSVVKLFNSIGGACTGAVVARDKVLTAAHCLYASRTHRFLPADAIHVLIGYNHGDYRLHVRVSAYATGPGYDPGNERATIAADWAILTLVETLPADIRPLLLSQAAPPADTKVMLGGFPQDRAYAMTADTNCAVLRSGGSRQLVLHDCASLPGDSGAPLLDADAARGFAVYGVHVGNAAVAGSRVGVAAVPVAGSGISTSDP